MEEELHDVATRYTVRPIDKFGHNSAPADIDVKLVARCEMRLSTNQRRTSFFDVKSRHFRTSSHSQCK